MKNLDILLAVTIPALIVLTAMYLTIRSFVNKELNKGKIELKLKQKQETLPIRLQAYERIILFLERISPSNMILRVNQAEFNVAVLQTQLVHNIREEFNHNMSQQLYVSELLWAQVKTAMEGTITLINAEADQIPKDAPSLELAKAIFTNLSNAESDNIALAISLAKKEVTELF